MKTRIAVLAVILCQLSGCVVTPRIEIAENLDFNYAPPSQTPMSYEDVLCCYDCTA